MIIRKLIRKFIRNFIRKLIGGSPHAHIAAEVSRRVTRANTQGIISDTEVNDSKQARKCKNSYIGKPECDRKKKHEATYTELKGTLAAKLEAPDQSTTAAAAIRIEEQTTNSPGILQAQEEQGKLIVEPNRGTLGM